MCIGSIVIRELVAPQCFHLPDSLDGPHGQALVVSLVSETGQAFFQTELEPIPAGHPVAGPVVKHFMGNNSLDNQEIAIRGGVLISDDTLCSKEVQPLVLHCIAVTNQCNDVVSVQVIFESIRPLIPSQSPLQRSHGMIALICQIGFDIDIQLNTASTNRIVVVFQTAQLAGKNGENVAGFGYRIVPAHPPATVCQFTLADLVSVTQHDRIALAITR